MAGTNIIQILNLWHNLYEYLIREAVAKHPIENISINEKVKEET